MSLFSESSYRSKNWWRHGDSNPRPIACKATALPTELYPHLAAVRRLTHRSVRCFSQSPPTFCFFVCSFVLSCHKQKLNCALPFQSIRGIRPLDRTRIALFLELSEGQIQTHRAIDLCSPAGIGNRQAASALRGIEH